VEIGEVLKCRSKSGFVSMDAAHVILATTPSVMDCHWMGSVKDVSLCTSFTFTPRSPKEAEDANLIVVRASSDREERQVHDVEPSSETGDES
jgi:hypothetical protein